MTMKSYIKIRKTKTFIPTSTQKKALAHAERHLKQEKTLSYHELIAKLKF